MTTVHGAREVSYKGFSVDSDFSGSWFQNGQRWTSFPFSGSKDFVAFGPVFLLDDLFGLLDAFIGLHVFWFLVVFNVPSFLRLVIVRLWRLNRLKWRRFPLPYVQRRIGCYFGNGVGRKAGFLSICKSPFRIFSHPASLTDWIFYCPLLLLFPWSLAPI